jgi:hypothetical protein
MPGALDAQRPWRGPRRIYIHHELRERQSKAHSNTSTPTLNPPPCAPPPPPRPLCHQRPLPLHDNGSTHCVRREVCGSRAARQRILRELVCVIMCTSLCVYLVLGRQRILHELVCTKIGSWQETRCPGYNQLSFTPSPPSPVGTRGIEKHFTVDSASDSTVHSPQSPHTHPSPSPSMPRRTGPRGEIPSLETQTLQCVMGRLVHTGLGSSSLVAHVLQYPPPTTANSFVLGPAVINTHTPSTLGLDHARSLNCGCRGT